jgi:hypothetical protein
MGHPFMRANEKADCLEGNRPDVKLCTKGNGPTFSCEAVIYVGDDLLSHTLSRAVQSAQQGLTSVFGMGTGVSPAVESPATCCRQLLPQLPGATISKEQ